MVKFKKTMRLVSSIGGIRYILYQCNVVAFKHYSTQLSSILRFHVILLCVVQNQIHVLIESDNVTLDSEIHVLIKPHLHSGPVLEVSEDEVDRLDHHLLHFLRFVGHFLAYLWNNLHPVNNNVRKR